MKPYLSIRSLRRHFSSGNAEELRFDVGVNLLVGRPNTGKTKWLQTLDYLLGDPGENPFEAAGEDGLAEKYSAASADFVIGDESFTVERKWRERRSSTKVLVDGRAMSAQNFQHFLLDKLQIPLLHFPKGNPASGQTWPELSFRMLLRHVYRQQRFWGSLADLQPEAEQHASLLQFLGLAERVFTEEYGQLIEMTRKAEQLKAQRDQYRTTLDELTRDVLSQPGFIVGATETTVREASNRLEAEIAALRKDRTDLIANARDQTVQPNRRPNLERLGEQRVQIGVAIEQLSRKLQASAERVSDLRRYRAELGDEFQRLTRTEDAGEVLADLKITHCPACDQTVENRTLHSNQCFLCHQGLPDEPLMERLGAVRLQFELSRLSGEIEEADELVDLVQKEVEGVSAQVVEAKINLSRIEGELAPARDAIAAFVQEEVSSVDMRIGELTERQRQLGRVSGALELGKALTARVAEIEKAIEPLDARVSEIIRATDFHAAAAQLEEGMNNYLGAIEKLRPGFWRHNPVRIDISRWTSSVRVGMRRWHGALGGTDSLYFLMSYHYGLLSLSGKAGYHYPGFAVIDVPAEFAGELVEDKENFIVQPFIDLLSGEGYSGAQLIITGASFAGLDRAKRIELKRVYVA